MVRNGCVNVLEGWARGKEEAIEKERRVEREKGGEEDIRDKVR